MKGIRQVARVAGVSPATVSRVINGDRRVRKETRDHVQTIIDKMDYRPHRLASLHRGHVLNVVALFLENKKSPFATMLSASIERTLHEEGFQVLSCCTRAQVDRERKYTDTIIEMQIAAAIIRPSNSDTETAKNVRRLREAGIPVVYVDLLPTRISEFCIVCDNYGGGRLGMEHLIGHGHRNIGVIAARRDQDMTRARRGANLRVRGIMDIAVELGLTEFVRLSPPSELLRFDFGYEAAKSLLAAHPQITALFAVTDMAAIGAIHAASDIGLEVPDDLSVMGYDGIPISSILVPPLTTVAQPISEMGTIAARTAIELIRNPDIPPKRRVLDVRLVEGRSVGLPAQAVSYPEV